MLVDGFVLGVVASFSFVAALFFLRFWRRTRDFLFLAFAIGLGFQALGSAATVFTPNPTNVSEWIYDPQIVTYVFILAAILIKNRRVR